MKTLKYKVKLFPLMLSILLMFQSCVTVYKSGSLTLEEANDRHIKTKVVTKSGEKLKFKNIEFKNGVYYGVKKKKRQIINIPLDQDAISVIKIKDRTLSTIVNIPLVIGYVSIVTGLAYSYGTGGL